MPTEQDKQQVEKDIDLLLSYSGNVIASYSLLKNYDPKSIAHAIDRLFGEYGHFHAGLAIYWKEGEDGYPIEDKN